MPIILDTDDCGWVATLTVLDNRPGVANRQTLRRFVAYIQRKDTTPTRKILICERLPNGLSAPIAALLPGVHESMCTLECIEADAIVLTYLGRAPNAPDGPFMLQEETIAVPGIFPIGLAACNRVRNVAQLVAKYVPASAEQIAPYTK